MSAARKNSSGSLQRLPSDLNRKPGRSVSMQNLAPLADRPAPQLTDMAGASPDKRGMGRVALKPLDKGGKKKGDSRRNSLKSSQSASALLPLSPSSMAQRLDVPGPETREETFLPPTRPAPGDLENKVLEAVIIGQDIPTVREICVQNPGLLWSKWGNGVAATCILYAARAGDLQMCKCLHDIMGKKCLEVKDISGKNAIDFASKTGVDLEGYLKANADDDDEWKL